MTDKEKILAEIERRLQYSLSLKVDSDYYNAQVVAYEEILDFINSLPEEPVSIWHDTNQQPEIYTTILVRTYDNIVTSTKRYDDSLIPWEDRIKKDGITNWCYVEDLLKL